jgi:hypothetical protein
MNAQPLNARIGVSFQLECRDADGNLLKVIDCAGSLPLDLTPTADTVPPQETQDARVE